MPRMSDNYNKPLDEFGLLCLYLKNSLLFHGTKPVRHSKDTRVIEPVNPVKCYIHIQKCYIHIYYTILNPH